MSCIRGREFYIVLVIKASGEGGLVVDGKRGEVPREKKEAECDNVTRTGMWYLRWVGRMKNSGRDGSGEGVWRMRGEDGKEEGAPPRSA